MIVGTAGHVDHGKTALIQRLTGIDTDRLKEEKARGLTIEPGFAYPEMAEDVEFGFVDVPGHERFIHNMLAGAAGIDYVLLVVAADDGVMPQTVEHLQILKLLGLSEGVVALTKSDLVDAARLEEAKREIVTLLADTPLAGAPVFPVSSRSGEGIETLRDRLWTQAQVQQVAPTNGHFRLAVDRAFTKIGAGLVVTGTVVSGRVNVGDFVRLFPSGLKARVRSLRRQNRDNDFATQGDRLALNLVGSGVDREVIGRGGWVIAEALESPALKRLDIAIELLDSVPATLEHWTPVHIHLGATHVTGRVSLLEGQRLAPGERMLGQLTLDTPVHACLGDRVVIRDHGAHVTLGGGLVLDGAPPRRGQRAPKRLAWLAALRDSVMAGAPYDLRHPLKAALALRSEGLDLVAFAHNVNRDQKELIELVSSMGGRVISAQGEVRAFSRLALEDIETNVLAIVTANHEREPAMLGTERERLRRQVMPNLSGPLFRLLLNDLFETGQVEQHGPFVALPGHRVTLNDEDAAIWDQVRPLLEANPFEPPRVRDIATSEKLDEQRIRTALIACARLGEIYHVRRDHFFMSSSVRDMAVIVQELVDMNGTARAAEFRNRIGTGRKLAIHILEFFDRIGFTRRMHDDHLIRRADMWH
ncbi:selenocysteine-specific translation elongation factor [Phytohalomonas tamaricis]|uniref:selenocysteine-specific translation elongation factor n=1 Tax=Phytohalomonas tamaricis TaxID=2081032 RepID=UPI000D0B3918|nr:selenocysteine-specific translation elongation factor [Phytohalomonas tamaricis]